jgi:hypothetical protein
MRNHRSRLLITLILLAVVSTSAWTTAHARPPSGTYSGGTTLLGGRPGARPASGEPDVPETKLPAQPHAVGVSQPDLGANAWTLTTAFERFRWISRIWMATYLGVR